MRRATGHDACSHHEAVLHCLTFALIGLGSIATVCADHRSFATFELVMFAVPAVGVLAGAGIIVSAVRRYRLRGRCAAGCAIVAVGVALEVKRIIDWATVFADPTLDWRPYQLPQVPVGFGISVPFLVAGVLTIRRGPGTRWRYRRGTTALLVAVLAIASIWALGSSALTDLCLRDGGVMQALPKVAHTVCAMVVVLAGCIVVLDGFVDDRAPRAIVVRRP